MTTKSNKESQDNGVALLCESKTMHGISLIIGVEATNLLIDKFAGTTVRITYCDKIHENHKISNVIGHDLAELLCMSKFCGKNVYFPSSWRCKKRIRELIDSSGKINSIAHDTMKSYRTVYRHKAKSK